MWVSTILKQLCFMPKLTFMYITYNNLKVQVYKYNLKKAFEIKNVEFLSC